ncbi:MAG: DUF3179 domain-containing protein [Casimicrobiaceae bacterium]
MQMRRHSLHFWHAALLTLLAATYWVNQPVAAQTVGKSAAAAKKPAQQQAVIPLTVFYALGSDDEAKALAALKRIRDNWQDAYAAMLLEIVGFLPGGRVQVGVVELLEWVSGRPFGGDLDRWYEWLWSIERKAHPEYAEFKATVYASVDSRFREYFENRPKTSIRLDEIRWGGVRRDGIPPLKNPKMIPAKEATWLQDDNVIFGVAIDGDVRAYPKRILAWHEMFKDKIAGRELNGVYCTLCGSMILYDVTVNGMHHELGTSGFLYRSNKLMYDHATKSLWSTLTGTPVVGPLTGKGIELKPLYVVTTTWKEWRTRHPESLVLSLDTGHQRDYREGAAYRAYFATDRLMFTVPKLDDRLLNKAEVLALRSTEVPGETLAIAAEFLSANPLYHDRVGRVNFVVLTDTSGANRVYDARDVTFASWNGRDAARDRSGTLWKVDESQLIGPDGATLPRLPAHRAFWFGWFAAYPDTRLVK